MWWHMHLILTLSKQRQVDLLGFKASLVFIMILAFKKRFFFHCVSMHECGLCVPQSACGGQRTAMVVCSLLAHGLWKSNLLSL